jgi:hypothetical protein
MELDDRRNFPVRSLKLQPQSFVFGQLDSVD